MASRIRALNSQRKRVLKRARTHNDVATESRTTPPPPEMVRHGMLSTLMGGVVPTQWTYAILGGSLAAYSLYSMLKGMKDREPAKAGMMGGLSVLGGALMYRGVSGLLGEGAPTQIRPGDNPAASVQHNEGVKVEESVVVDCSPKELYEYWRHIENLPSIMQHLRSVVAIDDKRSHWTVQGPMGSSVEWDAEVYTDEPGSLISWRSLPGAEVDNAGSVQFEDLGDSHGTTVTVMIKYAPPGGKLGALVSELLGDDPAKQIRHDLRRFKRMMESGEAMLEDRTDHQLGSHQ